MKLYTSKQKAPGATTQTSQLHANIATSLYRQLANYAEKEGVTITSVVEVAIANYLTKAGGKQ